MTEAAAVLGALGATGLLLARSRILLLSGLGLLALATALLAAEAPTGDVHVGAAAIGLLAVGMLALALLAAAFLRFPVAVLPLLLLAAPLRLPLEADGANLVLGFAGTGGLGRLYPFYLVLAGAVLALVWRIVRGHRPQPLPRPIAIPLALLVALTSLSLLWSADRPEGTSQLVFFWFPFTALVAVAAHTPFSARAARALGLTLVAEAALFAAVGIWQAISHELLFFTVALERANDVGSLFRVTSAFQDPNHYGRFLVLGLAVALVALWLDRLRVVTALPLVALLAAGLYFSYSQSSMVSLVVVALAVAAAAGNRPVRHGVAALALVLALAGAGVLVASLGGVSAASLTSDRSTLVEDTGAVFLGHPLAGVGVGAQPRVTRDETERGTAVIQNASHTTPLTVAAELGVIGVAAWAALVLGAFALFREVGRRRPALGLSLGAVLLALLVHSLFYAGLFENPITFGVVGTGAAALIQRPRPSASAVGRTGKPLEALRS